MAILISHVFAAREALERLTKMRLRPALAFRLSKYMASVNESFTHAEKIRVETITRLGSKKGENFSIDQESPGWVEFNEVMAETLGVEAGVAPFPIPIEDLVEEVGKFEGNALSASDILLLEAFFAAPQTVSSAGGLKKEASDG